MYFEPFTVLKNQDVFKELFNVIEVIGSGGEATVYLVECKETLKRFALCIDRQLKQFMKPGFEKPVKEALFENQKINPNQNIIFDYFWIQSKNLGKAKLSHCRSQLWSPTSDLADGDILIRIDDTDPTAETFRHRVTLQEVGLCDLSSSTYKKLVDEKKCDKAIDLLSIRLCGLSFIAAGIRSLDCKLRNHILMESGKCYHNGERFSEYDYWAYHLDDETVIYIPKQLYVVKRIDYIDWKYHPSDNVEISKAIQRILDYLKDNNLEFLLEKPGNNDEKILDVYPLKSFQPELTGVKSLNMS